jgi:hypothetical protein
MCGIGRQAILDVAVFDKLIYAEQGTYCEELAWQTRGTDSPSFIGSLLMACADAHRTTSPLMPPSRNGYLLQADPSPMQSEAAGELPLTMQVTRHLGRLDDLDDLQAPVQPASPAR